MKLVIKLVIIIVVIVGLVFGGVLKRNYFFDGEVIPVKIPSGDIILDGLITLPTEGEAPYPIIVKSHGAGPEIKDDIGTRSWAKEMNRLGFAVLIFDKRGAGSSTGDFSSATLDDFKNDLIAAIDFVSTQQPINISRIGLVSVSESSWYAPEVALVRPQIEFLIQKVGTTFSWGETVAWEVYSDSLSVGINESGALKLKQLALQRWDYFSQVAADFSLREGELFDALVSNTTTVYQTVDNASEMISGNVKLYEHDTYVNFAANYKYNPSDALQQMKIPVLFLLGGSDINIPTADVAKEIDKWRDNGMENISYHIFPDAGHSLASLSGFWDAGYVPGFFTEIRRWLESNNLRP